MATPPFPKPHPHLLQPILFLSGFPSSTPDSALVDALKDSLKLRLYLVRDPSDPSAPAHGKVEFETLEKTELAYATANGQRLSSGGELVLSLSPSPLSSSSLTSSPATSASALSLDPQPSAPAYLIKQLPPSHSSPPTLFTLLRPFGPIHSLTLLFTPSSSPHNPARFRGQVVVRYYDSEDAERMREGMHFREVGGQNVAVSRWDKAREASAEARDSGGGEGGVGGGTPRKSFSPATQAQNGASPVGEVSPGSRTSRWATEQSSSLPVQAEKKGRSVSGMSQWGVGNENRNGEMGEVKEGKSGEGAAAPVGGVDPCNLYIKSLPSLLTSSHLRALFSPYGRIVSARVMMTSPTTSPSSPPSLSSSTPSAPSVSREFGFVSFTHPSMAEKALRAVDGQFVAVSQGGDGEGEEGVLVGEEARGREGARRVTVRVHEKRAVREARRSPMGGEEVEGVALPSTPARPAGAVVPAPSSSSPSAPSRSSPSASRWASATPAPVPAAPSTPSPAPAQPQQNERERLIAAVKNEGTVEEGKVEEVVELLESLPKKDRALCLFNPAILSVKITDALAILSLSADADDTPSQSPAVAPAAINGSSSPKKPTPTSSLSLAQLAALPLPELLAQLDASVLDGLGVTKPTAEKKKETEVFMDGLEGRGVNEVKQKLGERVFKALKSQGVKGAPRITIHLLDSHDADLRALARLVDYPEVLRERAEGVGRELKVKAAAEKVK